MKNWKTLSTLVLSLALVSIKEKLLVLAKFSPSSILTSLLSFKSHLLPIKKLTLWESLLEKANSTHFWILSNDFLLVIS